MPNSDADMKWLRWLAGIVATAIGAWLVALTSAYVVLARETPTREELRLAFSEHARTPHEGAVRAADYQADRLELSRNLEIMQNNLIRLMVAQGVRPVLPEGDR